MYKKSVEGSQLMVHFPLAEKVEDESGSTREEFLEILEYALAKWGNNWKLVVDEVNLQARVLDTLRSYQKDLAGTLGESDIEKVLANRRPNYIDALREFLFKVYEVNKEGGSFYVF